MIYLLIGVLVLLYLINPFPYYSDYFYQNRSDQKYSTRGGASNYATSCGIFYVSLRSVISSTAWNVGAALSYKPVSCVLRIELVEELLHSSTNHSERTNKMDNYDNLKYMLR